MIRTAGITLVLIFSLSTSAVAATPLEGKAAALYQQALKTGRAGKQVTQLKPEIRPTSDGESFWVMGRTVKSPKKWIVSLHGAGKPAKGFAADDYVVWQNHLKGRDVGLACLQWWKGTGDLMDDFLTPLEMYREIERLLVDLEVQPGDVMLHGFSRGSANTYAVASLDAGKGKQYFSLIVASSGGMSPDYPPNRALLRGEYGDQPLKGTRWITVAGAKDPSPDRDGIVGMRKTAEWLNEQGAAVERIEDPNSGHGALHLNPKNCQRVLNRFLK